jgi:hypothetical protein
MRFSSELTEPERTFTSGVSPLGGCYLCRRRVPTVKMNRLQTFFSKGLGRYGQEPAAPRARGLQLRPFSRAMRSGASIWQRTLLLTKREGRSSLTIVSRVEITAASLRCQIPLDPATKAGKKNHTQDRHSRFAPRMTTWLAGCPRCCVRHRSRRRAVFASQ